jgi:hypothetical protein
MFTGAGRFMLAAFYIASLSFQDTPPHDGLTSASAMPLRPSNVLARRRGAERADSVTRVRASSGTCPRRKRVLPYGLLASQVKRTVIMLSSSARSQWRWLWVACPRGCDPARSCLSGDWSRSCQYSFAGRSRSGDGRGAVTRRPPSGHWKTEADMEGSTDRGAPSRIYRWIWFGCCTRRSWPVQPARRRWPGRGRSQPGRAWWCLGRGCSSCSCW